MENHMIQTSQMSVGYGKQILIDDINLTLHRGEIMTLIGPNGSGKSTILKSIIKQLDLMGGTVSLDGKDMMKLSSKDIAMKMAVLMTQRINPELMTCEDMVATGRYPYTGRLGILSKEDHEIVEKSLEAVSALDLRDQDFNQISDGQRQRVLLARAICQEPEIIILDEPTSFLDMKHKLDLLLMLKKMVQEKNIGVIMSLHELDLAQKISDTVVCVHGDHIARVGTADEVFESEFIKELYSFECGSYNTIFGSAELAAPEGKAQVFVIGGNGTGITTYRWLQKRGMAFVAGILPENDIDYQVAAVLAEQVITSDPFEPVTEEIYQKAIEQIDHCRYVLCLQTQFGTLNAYNKKLKEYAQQQGKLTELSVLSKED